MISLQRSMHSSQMYTPGPAISFLTCFCDLPQNEHFNRSPPSPNLAIWSSPLAQGCGRRLLERTCPLVPPATIFPLEPTGRSRQPAFLLSLLGARDSQQLLGGLPALDDLVDDPVLLGLAGGHDEVAVGVAGDLLHVLARVGGQDLVQHPAHADDLAGLDLDVDRLALGPARRLVDQDAGMGQAEPLARGAGGQQHGRGRGGLAHAGGGHVRLDVLHGVVDGQQRRYRPAGRVDVQLDVLVRVLGLQVQQLGHDQVGHGVVDRGAEEDDPLVEQARVDVEGPLAAIGLLDDDRDQIVGRWLHRRYSLGSEASSGAGSVCSACSTMYARALLRRISPAMTPPRPPARACRTSSGSSRARWACRWISASISSSVASKPSASATASSTSWALTARSDWARRSASTSSVVCPRAWRYCSRLVPIIWSCWAKRLAR